MEQIILSRSFGTHDGSFHADEVTACALLLFFNLKNPADSFDKEYDFCVSLNINTSIPVVPLIVKLPYVSIIGLIFELTSGCRF